MITPSKWQYTKLDLQMFISNNISKLQILQTCSTHTKISKQNQRTWSKGSIQSRMQCCSAWKIVTIIPIIHFKYASFDQYFLKNRYSMGLIPTKWSLELANKITASSFCRRRLPVVMVRAKMADSVKNATQFVEQGHVRVGPEVVKDPAFIVTRYV